MKRAIALLITVILFTSLFTLFTGAESEVPYEDILAERQAAEKLTWVYVLIGIVATIGVISAAVIISKKVE